MRERDMTHVEHSQTRRLALLMHLTAYCPYCLLCENVVHVSAYCVRMFYMCLALLMHLTAYCLN